MGSPLEKQYDLLESTFAPATDPAYERLVTPTGNAEGPVHRWFHMKEAYSPRLLEHLLNDLSLDDLSHLRVHDPFAGSGTTLVSSMLRASRGTVHATGSEVNPFLHLVSQTKLASLSLTSEARSDLADELQESARSIADASPKRLSSAPALAAFADERYFPPDMLRELLAIHTVWADMSQSLTRDAVGVALAGAVEAASRLRRDGRALRYYPTKVPKDPRKEVRRRIEEIADDIRDAAPTGTGTVFQGSALAATTWPVETGGVDLVCFSPPYPNNIDYTEVYKLEAWFLGYITDSAAFRKQRLATMRSHPSIKFPERDWAGLPDQLKQACDVVSDPLLHSVPNDRYERQRKMVIAGYFADMARLLSNAISTLAPGGYAVCVVGNSRHGSEGNHYTIASDILIAELATKVGFDVAGIKIARSLHRRGRHDHLRESLVLMRKPDAA